MAGITLEIAEAQLAYWIEADIAVSTGQSYTIEENDTRRVLTRANADEITRKVQYWNNWCKKLDPTSKRGGYLVI